jgi:hypothetical protein
MALAMPFMTLQILFSPATNAVGRSGIALRVAVSGAVVLPIAFLIGIQLGVMGMAIAWLIAFPILTGVTAALSLPAIGVRARQLLLAIAPGLLASAGMVVPVLMLDSALPPMPPVARLATLVLTGAATYLALLLLFARQLVGEIIALVRKSPAAEARQTG